MKIEEAARILVVDDEKDTTDLLTFQLESAGFVPKVTNIPQKALGLVREFRPDLILLDVMMPDLNGYQICHTLKADRELQSIPVIFLTARGEPEDRIKGLETGVDDYLGKPFDSRELILRIRAVLKRAVEAKNASSRQLEMGNLRADRDLHQVYVDDETMMLTLTEFKLLQLLMENPNQVLSRETLLARVWNYESDTETRTVDTHVRRLREKLGSCSGMIETVRGVGYRMVELSNSES
ncbi:winged helix-turn-helix domain-containing protein [Puniceicoccus vermicola]|uniref:Phosphate regulon transcriptional regulatory protein PhoB n=1 Tax=Puniceicoccus vermicola TaxID=388746 RepID=A0A7X1AX80_9BACT|nr:response regulator transcription factor [Puniceicoccus vermicola]MBC2601434.1 response regulator transcription factor [Puniceicoccus vermicola]